MTTDDPERVAEEARSLVRSIDEQRVAETDAYWRGWRDCARALQAVTESAWSDGWDACEADMTEEWAMVARRVRALGSPDAHGFDERRAVELAACKPRPGDFPGLENDPDCLEPIRTSIESIARTERKAA